MMKLNCIHLNYPFLLIGVFVSFLCTCKKEDKSSVPIIETNPISEITTVSAYCGGTITDDGGSAITTRGVCWSVNPNPTIIDSITIDGNDLGTFTSNLTGLIANTTYYVRAYATNDIGTGYGATLSFTTQSFPLLTTSAVTVITLTTATCGGNVTSDGGSTITARGLCWSKNQNPTISDNKTIDGAGLGSFKSIIFGLESNTTYYTRAYATNNNGTVYGNVVLIITPDVVKDVDNNVYNTVILGRQTWMAENLKTTKYNDGSVIPKVIDNTAWQNRDTPGYCWYNNDSLTYSNPYGALYNWYVVSTAKLCPTGWRVPSDVEWGDLINYLGGKTIAGGKMKEVGTSHWESPNLADNSSGFTVLPAGMRSVFGVFGKIGTNCFFWSSSEYDTYWAWYLGLGYNQSSTYLYYNLPVEGLSVRCVKN